MFQQFTGLKDKNGKEIYEGDVIRHRSRNEYGSIQDVDTEVRWEGTGWNFLGGNGAFPIVETDSGEVIGNIYENPELLK